MTNDQVVALLRASFNGSQRAWAKRHNISTQYVSDVLSSRRPPGGKILQALGLKRVVSYERV